MNFGQSIASCLGNYAKFSGRACRSEYWYWTLFLIIIGAICFYIDIEFLETDPEEDIGLVSALVDITLFLPSLGVLVRRLHYIGRSGWWFFIILIPFLGFLVLVFWMFKAGDAEANGFGPSPFTSEGGAAPAEAAS